MKKFKHKSLGWIATESNIAGYDINDGIKHIGPIFKDLVENSTDREVMEAIMSVTVKEDQEDQYNEGDSVEVWDNSESKFKYKYLHKTESGKYVTYKEYYEDNDYYSTVCVWDNIKKKEETKQMEIPLSKVAEVEKLISL